MRKAFVGGLLAVAVVVGTSVAFAEDNDANAKDQTVTGILIDQACGSRMMKKDNPQEAAEGHPKSCAMKESCANSGYEVISGKKAYKLDKDSSEKAKEYLSEEKATTHVMVTGTTNEDGTMSIKSIKQAPDKDKDKDNDKDESK